MSGEGRRLIGGRYELMKVAGSGGMATVYRAVLHGHGAAGFRQDVAVKQMHPEFRELESYIHMFIEEARVGAELDHTNIVQVYDFLREPDGTYYLVMEWVEGLDLHAYLSAHLDAGYDTQWPFVAAIAAGVLNGLAAAHGRRRPDGSSAPVIHRDIAPQNILAGVTGAIKLTDFGLARARDRVMSLTAPGIVKGRMSYLAPELTRGQSATTLSDQFSLGAVLWHVLAGYQPFAGATDLDVFRNIRACAVEPLGQVRPDLPQRLVAAVHRALDVEPGLRFASTRDMAREFEDIVAESPLASDPAWLLGQHIARVAAHVRGEPAPEEAARVEAPPADDDDNIDLMSTLPFRPKRR